VGNIMTDSTLRDGRTSTYGFSIHRSYQPPASSSTRKAFAGARQTLRTADTLFLETPVHGLMRSETTGDCVVTQRRAKACSSAERGRLAYRRERATNGHVRRRQSQSPLLGSARKVRTWPKVAIRRRLAPHSSPRVRRSDGSSVAHTIAPLRSSLCARGMMGFGLLANSGRLRVTGAGLGATRNPTQKMADCALGLPLLMDQKEPRANDRTSRSTSSTWKWGNGT